LSEKDILALFEDCDAVWFHDGNPKNPHVELSSKLCSNIYFNCSKVFQYPEHCHTLANQLVLKLREFGVNRADWVIGPPYAAIPLSYEVAKIIGALHGFTERDKENPKRLIWRRFQIREGQTVLQIEDAVSTAKTLFNDRRVIKRGNKEGVKFLSVAGAIVLRPTKLKATYRGIQIVALIEREAWVKKRKNCPLCEAGSKRYRPKTHWDKLTKKR
jgi:orotate phosphoribosyltransferase